jgi:nucleotide-binding universal stress UspA family protein
MTHILVPTDFSECSGFAEKAAMGIAKHINAELVLMHGLSTGVDWLKLPKDKEDKYPEIKAQIGRADQELEDRAKIAINLDIKTSKSIVFLEGYKSISNTVLDSKHDLIVMGSHGKSAKSLVIGSNAGKILRSAKIPVLVVQKAMPEPVSFKTIVFASGLEPDTHAAFDRLLEFTTAMGAENLHLIEVTTPNNFKPSGIVMEDLKNYISHHHYKTIWVHNYNHFNVEAGIIEFAKKVDADLISIANHGRTDLTSLFIESIPENLVKYSDFPILSIRA